ncbi:hypothetical protein DFH27DRAFT_617266 [Peziza echinospora]|nr:hypothetical protein DFH27DRAFT_617266 [Peziza echinospora]
MAPATSAVDPAAITTASLPGKRSRRRRHKGPRRDPYPAPSPTPTSTETPAPTPTPTPTPSPNICLTPEGKSPGIYYADKPNGGRTYLVVTHPSTGASQRWEIDADGRVNIGIPSHTRNISFDGFGAITAQPGRKGHELAHDHLDEASLQAVMAILDTFDYELLQKYAVEDPAIIAAWEKHKAAVNARDDANPSVTAGEADADVWW